MKHGSVLYAFLAVLACVVTTTAPAQASSCPKGDVRVHVCLQYAGHKGEALKITGKCLRYGGYKCYPRNQHIQ
jgi:hypothetical protein